MKQNNGYSIIFKCGQREIAGAKFVIGAIETAVESWHTDEPFITDVIALLCLQTAYSMMRYRKELQAKVAELATAIDPTTKPIFQGSLDDLKDAVDADDFPF